MAAAEDKEETNRVESAEKPVREQLEKASIAGSQKPDELADTTQSADEAVPVATTEGGEVTTEEKTQKVSPEPVKHHTRKRSRDSTAEELERPEGQTKTPAESVRSSIDVERQKTATNGTTGGGDPRFTSPEPHDDIPQEIASPKTKRSRLLSSMAENDTLSSGTQATEAGSAAKEPGASTAISDANPTPLGANVTQTANTKTPEPQTSTSAFAASGFGALAGSSTSGFGSIGKSTGGFGLGGSFATTPKSADTAGPDQISKTNSASAFGGALGQKSAFSATPASSGGFGSGGSGFAQLGQGTAGFGSSGFGSFAGAGGLTSFSSGKQPTFGGAAKPVKAFGAPAEDENEEENNDENDDDDAGAKSPLAQEPDHQDERFYEQDIETGEENEDTRFTCRAKLYNFTTVTEGKKEWKERGLGTLRLNVTRPGTDSTSKVTARLVMRADGSHRVVLNTPVRKEIKFGSPNGDPPSGSFLFFVGAIDGGVVEPLQLKMKAQVVQELYEKITHLQDEM